jgi:hypothetical protein
MNLLDITSVLVVYCDDVLVLLLLVHVENCCELYDFLGLVLNVSTCVRTFRVFYW